MNEYQDEYFVVWTQDREKGSELSNLIRSTRFMVEYPYQDDSYSDRKFIAVAGQKDHVLQEGVRYANNGVPLVCVLCVKTSNSKHILRALKKIYGPRELKGIPRISFSGQDMTIYKGTSFDDVKSVATMLGENLAHHDDAFQHYCDAIYAIVNTRKIDEQHEKEYRELVKENKILWWKVKKFQSGGSKKNSFLAFLKKIITIVYVCFILYAVFLHPGTPEKINNFSSENSEA